MFLLEVFFHCKDRGRAKKLKEYVGTIVLKILEIIVLFPT